MSFLISTTVIVFFVSWTEAATDAGRVCKRNNPDLDKCIVDVLNGFSSSVKKGFPDLKIPSLDPLFVSEIKVLQGNGPVSIDSTFTNQKFHGISNYKIERAKINLSTGRMEFDVSLPWLYVDGDYNIKGQVLILPIRGNGDSWSNYTSVTGTAVLSGKTVQRSAKDYYSLENVDFDISVEKATIHMNNLFNGNKELGDAMNKFMTDNWTAVFKELKPVINETIETIIKDIAAKLFQKYSLNELFPE